MSILSMAQQNAANAEKARMYEAEQARQANLARAEQYKQYADQVGLAAFKAGRDKGVADVANYMQYAQAPSGVVHQGYVADEEYISPEKEAAMARRVQERAVDEGMQRGYDSWNANEAAKNKADASILPRMGNGLANRFTDIIFNTQEGPR